MIEYALLFGLGFVTAILAVLLLAPVVHRRIVKFTEERILATVPVSRQELRAQKDMVRAELATVVARAGHDLKAERGRAAALSIDNDQLVQQGSRLHSENSSLRIAMDEMAVAAGALRSSLMQEEERVSTLREALAEMQREGRRKEDRIAELQARIHRSTQEIDNLKIDLATRDTELEGMRARMNSLRGERETLRGDLKATTQRAKDAELRLAREENKTKRLEDRLNSEISGSVDKDTVIERRINEIARLKERLKAASSDTRETGRSSKPVSKPAAVAKSRPGAGVEEPGSTEAQEAVNKASAVPSPEGEEAALMPASSARAEKSLMQTRLIDDGRAAELGEESRSQVNAISDLLLVLEDVNRDDALRAEIADIAAKMVAFTAHKEGMASPIRSMISGKAQKSDNTRVSPSERASRFMHQE